ncbi:helix-turn-helix transcriptional regulator [Pseudomonas fluorescens]|nr:helix-turn-helix transcriptional regulator [Pseudomonas fluorescens]
MSHRNSLQPSPVPEPVRRVEAGPWLIELLPGSAYAARYVATHSAIGFAFDSQQGLHAIGSDRVLPFVCAPNSLAFVPAGCDVLSESPVGGEYLRVVHADGIERMADRVFNNRIDAQAIALAQCMRRALLKPSFDDDWQAWALALTERAQYSAGLATPHQSSINSKRMRLLDDFIDAGLEGPVSVQAMAGLLGLSEGFFMRAFKQATGRSPHSYLIDRRLARARACLRDSTASLSDIALACGFSSQAHMATAFKQRMGVGPAQLRACSGRARS